MTPQISINKWQQIHQLRHLMDATKNNENDSYFRYLSINIKHILQVIVTFHIVSCAREMI